jgi:type II secretory pathway component PulK
MKTRIYRTTYYSKQTGRPGIPPASRVQDKGSVLFIVLVFIISITILVGISTLKLSSEADFIQDEYSRLQAYTLAVSGFEFLKNRLITGALNNIEILDGLNEAHYPRLLLDGSDIPFHLSDLIQDEYRQHLPLQDLASMDFTLCLQDSSGLINVFQVDRTLFKNLLEYHGFPARDGDLILDSLLDWMDKDHFTRAHGAESDYYLDKFGYPAANRLLDSREELLLVRGITRDIYDKIGGLLDFNTENQGLNANTMPAETFYLFKGISAHQIERIMEKRLEPKAIEGLSVLTLVSGYNFSAYPQTFRFFTSNTTYVKIKVPMNEERLFYIQFRLDRLSGAGSMRRSTDGTQPGPVSRKETFANSEFDHAYHIYNWQEGTEAEQE